MADRVIPFPSRPGAEPPAPPALVESVLADLVQHRDDNPPATTDRYDAGYLDGLGAAIEYCREHIRFGSEPTTTDTAQEDT